MSDNNNSHNDTNEIKPKPSENEEQPHTDKRPGVENSNKVNAILPAIKDTVQNKEAIIDIDTATEKVVNSQDNKTTDAKRTCANVAGKNKYLVYGQYDTQIRPPKTTWVMFQGGGSGGTLSYDSSRNVFVRLVFGIVLLMLMFTAAFVAMVLFSELKETFRTYGQLLALPAIILMIGLNYAIACSPCVRIFPCNIVCLVLAVCGMSVICAYITSRYKTEIVFYALLSTVIVVMVCLLLACTSFDFTEFFLYVVVIGAAFGAVALMAGLYMMITGTYMKMLHLGILLVGTVLNVIILTMELQMILGGRAIEISEDDYALGAFLLYTSIVDVFLKMVQILGILDDS